MEEPPSTKVRISYTFQDLDPVDPDGIYSGDNVYVKINNEHIPGDIDGVKEENDKSRLTDLFDRWNDIRHPSLNDMLNRITKETEESEARAFTTALNLALTVADYYIYVSTYGHDVYGQYYIHLKGKL